MNYRTFREQLASGALPPFRVIFFDVDGTLASGRDAIPGADRFLQELREKQLPFLLLTNDSHHSPAEKCALLARGGITVDPEEVVSCSHVLQEFAIRRQLQGKKVFLMGEFGNPCYAEAARLVPCRELQEIDECAAVINGEGKFDWHDVFTGVVNFFRRHPDRPFLVPNPDSYWPYARTGRIGIGAGAEARFILGLLAEMKISIETIYFGKPYPGIFEYALHYAEKHFSLPELKYAEVMMVGDSLTSDIAGAKALGMQSSLVMTGITDHVRLQTVRTTELPDYVFESIC